ncbi:hypothetical protein [Aminobacter sp. MET-1]|uniref:hypothetical protein n=1 Tax=Aminobacter sp. MET-1 TaxID=2951085 RepID=UPI00226ACD90|nr:hypothetical protein [Aminobacter sp. MET-1]MCX8570732.1 hypothetical protein [Aminobacter sp. MET-1]
MLVSLTPRQRLEILANPLEPLLRAAFMEAIEDIRSHGVLRRILERLERDDIAGALDGMNLESQNPIDQVDKPKPSALKCPDTNGGVFELLTKTQSGQKIKTLVQFRGAEIWTSKSLMSITRKAPPKSGTSL